MNSYRTGKPSWVDSLARWAARGEVADTSRPRIAYLHPGRGITRRTALRAAAGTAVGAAVLSGPLELLMPPAAGAAISALDICREDNAKENRAAFNTCVKYPLGEFEDENDIIPDIEEKLRNQKKPAARKRLQRNLDRARRDRDRALKTIENCNAAYVNDQAFGEEACRSTNGGPGGTPSGGGPGPGGCDTGYKLCGDYCCDTFFAECITCNGMSICCRIGGNCCA